MSSRVTSLIAFLPMLLHSVLGCCWHHAHQHGGCEAGGVRISCQEAVDASGHSHDGHSACPSHRLSAGQASSGEQPGEPCRHFPCEEGRCLFVGPTAMVAQQLIDLELAWVGVPLVCCDLAVPPDSLNAMSRGCSDDAPPVSSRERRALTQVWLV